MGRRPSSGSGRRRGRTPLTGGGERLGLPQPTGCEHRDSPPDQRPQPKRQQQHQDQRVSWAQPQGLRRVPSAMRGTARAEPCRKRRRKPIATCSFLSICVSTPLPEKRRPVHHSLSGASPVNSVLSRRGRRTLGLRSAEFSGRHAVGIIRPDLEKKEGDGANAVPSVSCLGKPTQARPTPSIKERSARARKLSEPGCRCRSC